MTLLAGFLDVLLRSIGLVGLSAAAGGVAYAVLVLRAPGERSPPGAAAVKRALTLIAAGSGALALVTLLLLVIQPWALADELGRWPLTDFLATDFARAGLLRGALALCLAGVVVRLRHDPGSRAGWMGAAALAAALMVNAGWLTHAVSRLEGRAPLMLVTVLHQLGAAVWVGGIIHLVGFWLLRRRLPGLDSLAPPLLARFSVMALLAMVLIVGPGMYLSWSYIGDWAGLIGTGYGIMVLTKIILLAGALILAGLNVLMVRRWWGRVRPGLLAARVPAFVEAELGIGLTLLMAAASLTSLPPAADVVADRAAPGEVAARFIPTMPRLTSPPIQELLAAAAPIDDTLAARQPEEYAWSEYNHHMAGLFVFAMGVLALLERTRRARWARHWPLLLLGLAVFLLLRSDPRAWPLGPAGFWETMLLPDVLQHRLAVLLVVGLAVFEWLVRIGRLTAPRWRICFPVLCAVGGALLLTHSHAMFNLKAEFLAEVAHAPMGILAVFLGWGRWLELRLPEPDNRIPGWVWAVCLALIGVMLLMYREI